jgi:hypothetical protein
MYSRKEQFVRKALAAEKYILSLLKSREKWQFEDYPIRTRQRDTINYLGPERQRPSQWVADIVGWSISGWGETEEAAVEKLRENFAARKAGDENIPRPGTKIPIRFASSMRIERHKDLSEDFIHRVLKLEWAFISDESSLWDFHEEESNNAYFILIRSTYGIDVSDDSRAIIADILDSIAAHQA